MAMANHLDLSELENLVLASIDQRYQAQASRNLADYIFSNHLFQSFPPAFLEFVYHYREGLASYLSDERHRAALTDYCIRATRTYTYQRNQFINFTRFYDELLSAQYGDFFCQLRTALVRADTIETLADELANVLQQHHERLRLILSTYCLAYQPTNLAQNPLLETVACAEYLAQFQLTLLQLDLTELVEPILDIGCGQLGKLVEDLRSDGYRAVGLDRLAPTGPYFIQQDWFEFDYAQEAWGTIIAHQSLSTHFIHAHLHNSGQAERFARLYMSLLSSLRMGGKFCYAPGLPFIEDLLEPMAGYTISKKMIEADKTLGIGEVFYSVKVAKTA